MAPGDDAAVLDDGTALTADTLVEGVHWDAATSPEAVGYKAVTVSVSDLGAMGARPAWMLLCVSVPGDAAWIARFAAGISEAARTWGVPLVGGDTTRSPGPRVITVAMGGICPHPLTRSGGRPSDELWVTGTLGLAGLGYLSEAPPPAARRALEHPEPPLVFALALAAEGLATAAMDLSDGLAADLPRLCRLSGTGARLDPAALPLHPAVAAQPDPLRLAMAAGDDYELLFAADPERAEDIRALAARSGVAVRRIGVLTAGDGVQLGDLPWPRPAFGHFEGAR